MIVVLSGGTGGAKLVQGLNHVVPPENLTVIVNTADDVEWWGLHVSPDVDSILYALAEALSSERGWGLQDDSFRCLERMAKLGQPSWFSLGDLDLATHLARTNSLRAGKPLSAITAELAHRMGINTRVLPMSDDRIATVIETAHGTLNFQEYFVRERHQPEVRDVHFDGAERAKPAPGVLDAIATAEAIIFAPSNPVTSIGPILAVPGIRDALRHTSTPIVAVSPIIGGDAYSGPAGTLMKRKGWPSTIGGVAQAYEDFLDVLIVDLTDHADADHLREGGLHVLCANTVMKSMPDKQELARFTVHAALQARGSKG
jgi:LPPG:FO 2-phospho-L-lactate transferase